jgi:hypothetical protein
MWDAEKGEAISFISGTYQGAIGWINSSKKSKDKSKVHVIVAKEQENGNFTEKLACVSTSSISSMPREPGCFIEAVMEQQPDVEVTLTKLCKLLVTCGVELTIKEDFKDFSRVLLEKMAREEAIKRQKGNRAQFRMVSWNKADKEAERRRREKEAERRAKRKATNKNDMETTTGSDGTIYSS